MHGAVFHTWHFLHMKAINKECHQSVKGIRGGI
jgi:hypothetical protein